MTLLSEVVSLLSENGVPHAMIGATALAALGASRSTQDLDLLITDCSVLDRQYWSPLEAAGAEVDVRVGEGDDPLAGVVRLTRPGSRPVDIVVGYAFWQDSVIADAYPVTVEKTNVRAVDAVGFILLKLFAGGPQDLWDVEQVLAIAPDRNGLVAQIEERIKDLPAEARRLWRRVADLEGQ